MAISEIGVKPGYGNSLPQVRVPPPHVRERRALIAHRRQLLKQRTRLKNQLPSLLHRYPQADGTAEEVLARFPELAIRG